MRLYSFFKISVSVFLLIPTLFWAQAKTNTADQFHDFFFESLKQKGIENYDLALVQLQKCADLLPDNEAVYYEKGRNYFFLKQYQNAIQAYQKALEINPNNSWISVGLYEVYFTTKAFEKAIPIAEKLIPHDSQYQENLVALYMYTKQYDKALQWVKKLENERGTTPERDAFKKQLFADPKYQAAEIADLEQAIKKNPKEESNYISLLYLYTQANNEVQTSRVLELLKKQFPQSKWAQMSVVNTNPEEAILTLQKKISQYIEANQNTANQDADLLKIIQSIDDANQKTEMLLYTGCLFQTLNQEVKAVFYFKEVLKINPNDLKTHLYVLQSYYKQNDFKLLKSEATALIDLFPLQPDLFYLAGYASNQLQSYQDAKSYLEEGLDVLVNNTALEINFIHQLVFASKGLSDQKAVTKYEQQLTRLQNASRK